MKVVGIIQARMGSSRLPGKILMPIVDDKPLIEVLAVRACAPNVRWWIATTWDPSDDATVDWASRAGFRVYRGSVENVLSRFLAIAEIEDAEWVIRLTGDNPLVHSSVVSRLMDDASRAEDGIDLVRDPATSPRFPAGFVPEVARVRALKGLANDAQLPSFHRTHVTSGISAHRVQAIRAGELPPHPELRWTVDTPEDLAMVRTLLQRLDVPWQTATYRDLLRVVRGNPDIPELNGQVRPKPLEDG